MYIMFCIDMRPPFKDDEGIKPLNKQTQSKKYVNKNK